MGFLQRTVVNQLQRKLQSLSDTFTVITTVDEHNDSSDLMLRVTYPNRFSVDVFERNLQWVIYDGRMLVPTGISVSTPASVSASAIYRMIVAARVIDSGERHEKAERRKSNKASIQNAKAAAENAKIDKRLQVLNEQIAKITILSDGPEPELHKSVWVENPHEQEDTNVFSSASALLRANWSRLNIEELPWPNVTDNAFISTSVFPHYHKQPCLNVGVFDNVEMRFRVNPRTRSLVWHYYTDLEDSRNGNPRSFFSEEFDVRTNTQVLEWSILDENTQPALLVEWISTFLGLTYELAYRRFDELEAFPETKAKLTNRRAMYKRYVDKFLDAEDKSFEEACDAFGAMIPLFSAPR